MCCVPSDMVYQRPHFKIDLMHIFGGAAHTGASGETAPVDLNGSDTERLDLRKVAETCQLSGIIIEVSDPFGPAVSRN